MDIAALALNIDSSKVVEATNDLDRFTSAATKAGAAGGKVGASAGRQSGSIGKLVAEVQSANSRLSTVVGLLEKTATASKVAAVANDNLTRSFAQSDAHVVAYRNSLRQASQGADAATTSLKFTAREGLNASRQLADIGVTAASGMSPFLIALQQGPQLFDILQEKAVATGTSIGTVFRAAAAAVWAALAPILPFVLALAAAVGLLTAGFLALTRQANDDSGLKKYTTAMGYTKAEVAKLNAVTVTFGDTAKAVFQVGFERIATALGISVKGMAAFWDRFLDRLATGTRATLAGIYAGFASLSALSPQTVAERLVKGENPLKGVSDQFTQSYGDAQGFFGDVVKQAQKNAQDRQTAMAKGFYDKPAGGGAKADAFNFADLMKEADKMRNDLTKAQAQIGLYGEALARVTYEQDLLNQASERGLKLSSAQRTAIGGVASELAKLAEANRSAAYAEQLRETVYLDSEQLRMATQDIGLYGHELAYATKMTQLIIGAKRDHISITAELREEFKGIASDYADAQDTFNQMDAAFKAGEAAGDAMIQQAADRQKQATDSAREVTKSFFTDWINGARQGESVFKSFADSAVNSLNRIIDKMLDNTLDGFLNNIFKSGNDPLTMLLGGSKAAVTPNALGGVYGSPTRFANGGAFTNTVVNTPTLFRFANGAALGEMGEAGPEAIMPLSRGPDGKLGVQARGGGSGNKSVSVENHYHVSGAIDQSAIIAMIQQGGQATYDQVKRDLQSLLQQLDQDGAFAS